METKRSKPDRAEQRKTFDIYADPKYQDRSLELKSSDTIKKTRARIHNEISTRLKNGG